MKQVIARAGSVEVVEVPKPVCPDNGVLIRTEWSVISTGTESWAVESTEPIGPSELAKNSSMMSKAYRLSKEVIRQEGVSGLRDYVTTVRHPELPLGYSSAGSIVEIGRGVTDFVVGDRVACAGEGKAVHAEFASLPRRLVAKVPPRLPTRQAAFSTIGAIALHAVRISGAQVGESVWVIGAGLVGNLVAQIAKAAGCRVVCSDQRDDRLELAKSLGVDLVLKSDDPSIQAHSLSFTSGIGFDHVFVCAASPTSDPINEAARLARNRGQVIVVGRVGMDVERKDFYQKELRLLMTRSLGPGRYDSTYEEKGVDYPVEYVRWTLNRNMEAFMRLVEEGKVKVDELVDKEYPLASAPQAFESLSSLTKVALVLSYGRSGVEALESKPASLASPRTISGKINVALVGPGAFAKEVMIPLLRSSPVFNLRWLVSSVPAHAKQLQQRYRFDASTANIDEALADPSVGLVVITAPNHLHARMLEASIRAGKTALVEKPLCITREEFDEIKRLQSETGSPIIVGFNRRYAPLAIEMKKRMARMDGPFVINYRVNAGYVPSGRWSHDPELGGGRIIHECCHFFDFFNFLLGPGYPRIVADAAGIDGSNSVARDNVSVSLRYSDGSLATLVYVATGGKAMGRERVEVFGQKSSMVLDDFKSLEFYDGQKQTMSLRRQDKGHRTELEEIAKFLRASASSVIGTQEVFRATELTFRVDEAIRGSPAN